MSGLMFPSDMLVVVGLLVVLVSEGGGVLLRCVVGWCGEMARCGGGIRGWGLRW